MRIEFDFRVQCEKVFILFDWWPNEAIPVTNSTMGHALFDFIIAIQTYHHGNVRKGWTTDWNKWDNQHLNSYLHTHSHDNTELEQIY